MQGWTQQQMADKLSSMRAMTVSVAVVSQDLSVIRQEWQARRIWNIDQHVSQELAKLDYIEKQAWEAWFKSREDQKETVQQVRPGQDDKPKPVGGMITTRPGGGNDKFLKLALECVQERSKLLGLYASQKHDITFRPAAVGMARQDISSLDDRELEDEIKKLHALADGQQKLLCELDDVIIIDQDQQDQDNQDSHEHDR
jgi:hypothetical protein